MKLSAWRLHEHIFVAQGTQLSEGVPFTICFQDQCISIQDNYLLQLCLCKTLERPCLKLLPMYELLLKRQGHWDCNAKQYHRPLENVTLIPQVDRQPPPTNPFSEPLTAEGQSESFGVSYSESCSVDYGPISPSKEASVIHTRVHPWA